MKGESVAIKNAAGGYFFSAADRNIGLRSLKLRLHFTTGCANAVVPTGCKV